MWHQFFTFLLATAYACALVHGQSEIFQVAQRRNSRYCGRNLAEILSQICNGVYNTKFHKKSSYDSESEEDYSYGQQQFIDSHPKFPFRSRTNAASFIPGSFRRYARGVHDECCKKPCTMNELMTYCAKDR